MLCFTLFEPLVGQSLFCSPHPSLLVHVIRGDAVVPSLQRNPCSADRLLPMPPTLQPLLREPHLHLASGPLHHSGPPPRRITVSKGELIKFLDQACYADCPWSAITLPRTPGLLLLTLIAFGLLPSRQIIYSEIHVPVKQLLVEENKQ